MVELGIQLKLYYDACKSTECAVFKLSAHMSGNLNGTCCFLVNYNRIVLSYIQQTRASPAYLRQNQLTGMFAGIHAAPSQLSDLLPKLGTVPCLPYVYEQVTE